MISTFLICILMAILGIPSAILGIKFWRERLYSLGFYFGIIALLIFTIGFLLIGL